jgi:hypothetical protein
VLQRDQQPQDPQRANVFEGIHKNPLFTKEQWYLCLALGASVLPLNVLFRFIPSSIFPGA